ncbi:MAG: hypothetical protein RBS80_22975 [Thermoguttaceae bacterium]|jgi:hypothetical protein|nr:hypothetical protein [Thermoguttaceae bacterium]
MNWTRLHPLNLPAGLIHKKVQTALDAMNAQMTGLLEERQRFDEQLSKLLEADPAVSEPDTLPDVDDWFSLQANGTSRRYDLLCDEARLRAKIADFAETILCGAVAAAVDAARVAIEENEADIHRKLLDLGYHEHQINTPDPCMLMPGWIKSHPAVAAARAGFNLAHEAARQLDQFLHENTAAAKHLREQIDGLRAAAVHG